jgi:hypothetical protein
MNMTIRLVDLEKDHGMMCKWWKAHGWEAVPAAILPKLGAIAVHDGVPMGAAWLYMDNSVGVCWLEWLVTNPVATPKQSLKAINTVTQFLSEVAVSMDYGIMMTTCRQASLVRVYEKNGFTKSDEGVTHLVRKLREN